MPKKKNPALDEVSKTLLAYYAFREASGDDGLSTAPEPLRVAIAVQLDSAIQKAAPIGSVHREIADRTRLTMSEQERIPKLVGALVSLSIELMSEADNRSQDDTFKLYRILKLGFPNEFAVLKAVGRPGLARDPVAARQAIESCRNAMENFFKTLGGTPNWADRLEPLLSDKSLAKLPRDVYAYLSMNGAHARDVLEQGPPDAALALRLTEALMIRVLVKLGKW